VGELIYLVIMVGVFGWVGCDTGMSYGMW